MLGHLVKQVSRDVEELRQPNPIIAYFLQNATLRKSFLLPNLGTRKLFILWKKLIFEFGLGLTGVGLAFRRIGLGFQGISLD